MFMTAGELVIALIMMLVGASLVFGPAARARARAIVRGRRDEALVDAIELETARARARVRGTTEAHKEEVRALVSECKEELGVDLPAVLRHLLPRLLTSLVQPCGCHDAPAPSPAPDRAEPTLLELIGGVQAGGAPRVVDGVVLVQQREFGDLARLAGQHKYAELWAPRD